jgi:cytochrome c553
MRKLIKILGIGIGSLLGLIVLAVAVLFAISEVKLNQTFAAPEQTVTASKDPAVVASGAHIVTAITACGDCHGANLSGNVILDDPAIGKVVAPNLTPGKNSILTQRSDADVARVLRYAVKPSGKSVIIMASEDYHDLAEEDLAAIIAYLRTLPPVDGMTAETELRPLGRILLSLGMLPILTAESPYLKVPPVPAPPAGVTMEYGKYLAQAAGCMGCHGRGLSGGPIPGDPSGMNPPNLTPAGELSTFDEAGFINTMRTGVTPFGRTLSKQMPVRYYKNMTDDELKALWAYIRQVPPKPSGQR